MHPWCQLYLSGSFLLLTVETVFYKMGFSVFLPLVNLVCLQGCSHFWINRSVGLHFLWGTEAMQLCECVCVCVRACPYVHLGLVPVWAGEVLLINSTFLGSLSLSWFPSCAQVTYSYPKQPDKDLWPWSDCQADKERQHETDTTETLSESLPPPSSKSSLLHTHTYVHSHDWPGPQMASSPTHVWYKCQKSKASTHSCSTVCSFEGSQTGC